MNRPKLPTNNLSSRHQLTIALSLAILIALLLTVTSVIIYEVSGAAMLDLSRPGYEPARKQLQKTNGQLQFSSKEPIDQSVVKKFRSLYKKQTDDIHKLNSFNGKVLDDSQLLSTQSPE